ncbi:MAG: prolipoprotein diacylglyceryl transferase [Vitreoscilla sp.]|nr:prolipoprotein diacylglyceryl transferase [Vitreoscilla sp.]
MIQDAATATAVHALFEWGGMALGVALWRHALRAQGRSPLQAGSFAVLVGLLLGAALGNKAVFLAERPDVLQRLLAGEALWPGQSIVGGLLGGLVGVELAKRATGQTRSTGDAMVLPIALGLCVGRGGCLLAGLHDSTYGLPTTLPWGLDFGDGQARHPAQLYEMVFVAALALMLWRARERLGRVPGLAFKLFLASYLAWRLAIDALKPVPVAYPLGWSGIQWVCALALLAYAPWVLRAWRQLPASTP